MARVSIKTVSYGRKPKVHSGARVWIPPTRTKQVPVKDSKLPKAADKQSTLTPTDAMKAKRGSVKSAQEPGAVNVKRKRAWSKR